MKTSTIRLAASVAFALAGCRLLMAQQPTGNVDLRRDGVRATSGARAMQTTPEMWFYEQERSRYEDPKLAVRRRAEFRAAQRESRIASMQWFGMSNARPTASVTPLFGVYSPSWGSNSHDPYLWRPVGPTTVVVTPQKDGY